MIFWENFNCALKNKNIKKVVNTTVKKYLAHVIWKNDNSEDKYFAIVSINGRITHADKFKIIAFIKENDLTLQIHRMAQ